MPSPASPLSPLNRGCVAGGRPGRIIGSDLASCIRETGEAAGDCVDCTRLRTGDTSDSELIGCDRRVGKDRTRPIVGAALRLP